MPLTSEGKKVMRHMKQEYGNERGEQVFYAMINAKRHRSDKWHGKRKSK